MPTILRRLLIGEPLPTRRQRHERLPKWLALPVFASDALSSTAYATQEILMALVVVGGAFFHYSLPIAIAITLLLVTVAMSYTQTVQAYPQGGGSFIVARENLGELAGLAAASALLIDYVLTVAVSIAAGVEAITSAAPKWHDQRVLLGILFIALLTLANLRGVRESGLIFAPPTYGFIFSLGALIVWGVAKWVVNGMHPLPPPPDLPIPSELPVHDPRPLQSQFFAIWLILRAFASGCAALTGTEAVADGVAAFRPPESKNAAITLRWMAAILAFLFLGTTFLASVYVYNIPPDLTEQETVVSRVARAVCGGRTWFYYVIQVATAAILILAANTAYSDFPRLSSILARHKYAPRQMANLGDRLVFANGIVALGVFASLLIFVFRGSTHALIPLYAVGVFLSFTLSQSGMVLRWLRLRERGWQWRATMNGFGATCTGIVLVVIASVKFYSGEVFFSVGNFGVRGGAWMVLVAIPALIWWMRQVHNHYIRLAEQLSMNGYKPKGPLRHRVIVLVPDLHQGVMHAINYARNLSKDIEAVYVNIDPQAPAHHRRVIKFSQEPHLESLTPAVERLRHKWSKWVPDIPLTVLDSEYRSLTEPILDYLDEIIARDKLDLVTVIIPEFVPAKWWHNLLHNQSGLLLKLALLKKPKVVVTNVRYFLKE